MGEITERSNGNSPNTLSFSVAAPRQEEPGCHCGHLSRYHEQIPSTNSISTPTTNFSSTLLRTCIKRLLLRLRNYCLNTKLWYLLGIRLPPKGGCLHVPQYRTIALMGKLGVGFDHKVLQWKADVDFTCSLIRLPTSYISC